VNAVPRLTIGLPVYNGEKYLSESIESLLGQTYENFELVISDNASTDNTQSICRQYMEKDSRIRYIRQPRNIGLIPNENFITKQAKGEFFKLAAHDDLYASGLIKRCVDALDENREAVIAQGWEARIDADGAVTGGLYYSVVADSPSAPERFRSMLFDGWDDYTYGVIRTAALRRVHPVGSYHMADRTINVELSLQGPFCLIPEWLYFRRTHPEGTTTPYTVRTRCAYQDPRRANRFMHPAIRLYGEYFWGYISAINNASLSSADRLKCYGYFVRWLAARTLPVASRAARRETLRDESALLAHVPDISVDSVVAGRERKTS